MNAINILLLIKSFLLEIGELALQVGFSENLSGGPLNLKNSFVNALHGNRSLLLVAVTGFIIGLVFTLQSRPSSRVWRRVVDAIHGEYFDNSRNRPYYYRFDLCWAHWFRYRC
jgi:hypothetical protein